MPPARWLLVNALASIVALMFAIPAFASAAGVLEADVIALEFPATGIHDVSSQLSAKITNGGDDNAALKGVSTESPFLVDGGVSECDDMPTLAPGSSCNLVVRFAPTEVGPKSANVVLQYDDLAETQALLIPLSGSGSTGTLAAAEPSFYSQPYYFGGQQQWVSVNNPSAFTVIAESTSIVGPDAASFNINSSGCNGSFLAPGNNCGLNIQFNPGGPGTYVAQLEIVNSGGVSPLVVPLEAVALNGPSAVISPSSIEFPVTKVGTAAATQQVAVANEGDAPLQIQQLLVISGTPQTFPITNDGCSLVEIAPGDKCEVTVGFVPTKAGERNASIFVIANTPGPVTTEALSGEGMLAPNGSVSLTSQAKVGVPIVCLTSGFHDVDLLSFRWLRGASTIPGETQSVYVPTKADVGSTLRCEVTAENPVGTQSIASAPSAGVLGAAPGPQGPAGAAGSAGAAGAAGASGPAGAKGDKGKRKSRCAPRHRRSKAARKCSRRGPRHARGNGDRR
jgi:HYDIN/CFA65/VesB-like, Ig-like domain